MPAPIVQTTREGQGPLVMQGQSISAGELAFQQVAKTLPVAIYICDNQGRFTYYNDVAIKLWGYRPQLNSDSQKFCACYKVWMLDGTFVPPDKTPMAIAVRTGQIFRNVEALVARPDGSKFYATVNIDPIVDENGNLNGAVNVFQDITNLKSSELSLRESLQASEEKYHLMISEVEDYAIILLNRDGFIENWNKGAERIKGYKAEEVVGKHFSIFYSHADQDSNPPEVFLQKAANEGKASYEGWRVRKDGTLFWGNVVLTAIHNAKDEIVGFSKVTRDLTAKKGTEDELKAYAGKLEEKNTELEKMNQELASFAYISSHDLQEPLRKIQTFSSRILEIDHDNFSEKSREYFTRITGAAYRMRTLIDDLLAYSRANTSEKKLEFVDLNEILKEVQLELKEKIDSTNATIQISALPTLKVIPFQFQQLIINLLSNALKFTPPRSATKYYGKCNGSRWKSHGRSTCTDRQNIHVRFDIR